MVNVIRFKRYFDISARLPAYDAIWAIDSDEQINTTYCIADGKFAILCSNGVVWCPTADISELIGMMRAEIAAEIKEIVSYYKIA